MATFFEVWDDATANRLGEFETVDEARALLGAVLRESGPDAASTLAVLAYTRADETTDAYDVATVLEGADFVAQAVAEKGARSAP
ncbi:MAG: hypothetical protein U0893_07235 [Chloroflexota bacterium]